MRKFVSLLAAALLACVSALPAPAQVPGGLMRFGTTGVFAPQVGDCLSILAMNSSGQTATDSQTPCTPVYLATNYTNATTAYTAIMSLPPIAAGAVARGECTITWEDSSTSGTTTFAAQLSGTPTDLWITTAPTSGVFVAPTAYTITSTTQTAVSGALVTTTANAPYQLYLSFMLVAGTVPTTLTIYAESNSASYTVTALAGSSCSWIP